MAAATLAMALFAPLRWRGSILSRSPDETGQVVAELAAFLPDDPRLAERLASRWKNVAGEVARVDGTGGLKTLDLLGEEAAELFRENPAGFHDLTAISRLDRALLEASTGPWREAVLQWARAGKLSPYLDHLSRLNPDQQALLTRIPGCLPLLGRGASGAEAMLSRHGERAWELFLCLDFAEDVAGVERVAGALAIYGDRMLRVNESHGPVLSFLFVAPREDPLGILPRLFARAIDCLGVEEAGALFLANYDDLIQLVLVEGHASEEVVEALDLLAGQPEEVRALASDNGRVMRLLLERRGDEPIGVEILARCGPEAADLLFEDGGYGEQIQEKAAVLAILARRGWPGVELLRRFRHDESWHRLIRRPDLLDGDDEPLIVRLAGKLENSAESQDQIERYLKMPRQQILEEDIPPTTAAKALEWVPGYLAVHTTYQAARGDHLENSEVALALLDGVTTTTFLGKLLGQSIKTVGRQAPREALKLLERQAASELVHNPGRQASRTILNRLPSVLLSTTRELPVQLPTLDITSVIRTGSGLSRKLGLKTWGKLDRRIIMRGDRVVVVDLSDPKVIRLVRDKVKGQAIDGLRDWAIDLLKWKVVGHEVGLLGPCLMEGVHPGLRSSLDDLPLPSPGPIRSVDPVPVEPRARPASLRDHPAWTPIGSSLIAICLIVAIPRAQRRLMRRIGPGPRSSNHKPRRYEE
jgi:hypothetical protein